jgi:hypothetical protein
MSLLTETLENWDGLWRNPQLCAANAVGELSQWENSKLADAVVAGIASPQKPAEIFESLIDCGEFATAESLLDLGGFRRSIEPPTTIDGLKRILKRGRSDAKERLDARITGLKFRAETVGLDASPAVSIFDVLDWRRADAESKLDAWEKRILEREGAVGKAVREEAGRVAGRSTLPSEVVESWKESIERCIATNELRVATFLLEQGPGASPPIEPSAISRLPHWPWKEQVVDVLEWHAGTAPAPLAFRAKWGPPGDDEPAQRMIELLVRAAEPVAVDPQFVSTFAETLDRFLGYCGSAPHSAEPVGGGFEARLHGLHDYRFPVFLGDGSHGVPLRIAPKANASEWLDDSSDRWCAAFGLEQRHGRQKRLLWFDARALLRLMPNRHHRKLNFLRELGSQLKPSEMLPSRTESLVNALPDDAVGLRSCVNWWFDMLGLDAGETAIAELVVYYTGGHRELIIHLVRELFAALSEHRGTITRAQLSSAWASPHFRSTARSVILKPFEDDPLARAVLGAARFAGAQPSDVLSPESIQSVIEDYWSRKIPLDQITNRMARLAEMKLLEATPIPMTFRIRQSGIDYLLADVLRDEDAYVKSALASFPVMGSSRE